MTTGCSGSAHRVDLLLNNLGHGGEPDAGAGGLGDERGRHPGRARGHRRAAALQAPARRPGSQPARRADARAAGSVAPAGLEPAGSDRRTARSPLPAPRSWTRLAVARRRWASIVLGAGLTAELNSFHLQFQPPPKGQEKTWIEYLNKDLRTILGETRSRHVLGALLRRRQPHALPGAAVGRDLDRAGEQAGRRAGPQPERLAFQRHRRADHLRARPAALQDGLHQPAQRHPADHELLRSRSGTPGVEPAAGAASRRPASASPLRRWRSHSGSRVAPRRA